MAGTILDSDRWMNAMKSQYISPTTGVRETPLRLLIKQFPELAKKAFDRCVENNLRSESKELGRDRDAKETVTADDPRFAITLNYEMLDDTYCLFQVMTNTPVLFRTQHRINFVLTSGREEHEQLVPQGHRGEHQRQHLGRRRSCQ